MSYAAPVKNNRRILCIFPAYAPSFGTFNHAYSLMWRVNAFMPPQGLLAIAAYLPSDWSVRFIDENLRPAQDGDFAWADAVFVSGMHIQETHIHALGRRAKAAGCVTAIGGPSASGAPEKYAEFDYVHIGELGDATDRLIRLLDESVAPPARQVLLTTVERMDLQDFPTPAYHLTTLARYLIGSIQFSSGCPYQCEFCDIPALYGRQPRFKTPAQITRELDAIIAQKAFPTTIYFVDDNFIGNRKAARLMLPHLIAWQEARQYPVMFACEATLNLAKETETLELMRRAGFVNVFVGIESPEIEALKTIRKGQNATIPMLDAIDRLNSYGLEVTSGIILGLDTDSPQTEENLKTFIDASQIPLLTINLLQALPKTPLWDRLAKDGRIVDDRDLESNVRFLRPYDEVVQTWRRCVAYAYAPNHLFARFEHQLRATFPNRHRTPAAGKLTRANLWRAAVLAIKIVYRLGLRSSYRRQFWRIARLAWKARQIDALLGIGFVSYHLIEFSREALRGAQNASFYAVHSRNLSPESGRQVSRRRLFGRSGMMSN